MKASNIILASAIGSITLLILTSMMQIRFSTHSPSSATELQSKKINLPEFRYLVVDNIQSHINISSGKAGEIEMSIDKESELPEVDFHLQGDTLFIDKLELPNEYHTFNVVLNVPESNLQWIKGNNSRFSINNFESDSVHLDLDHSNVSLNDKNSFKMIKIQGANDSEINAYMDRLDAVDLDLTNSRATVHATVKKLQGSMSENSQLSIRNVDDFEFKKDESSRFIHWN